MIACAENYKQNIGWNSTAKRQILSNYKHNGWVSRNNMAKSACHKYHNESVSDITSLRKCFSLLLTLDFSFVNNLSFGHFGKLAKFDKITRDSKKYHRRAVPNMKGIMDVKELFYLSAYWIRPK